MSNLVKFETVDQLKELCAILAKSGLHKGETPEQAFTKIMYGQELGLPPMAARSAVHVIQGKPTLSSNAMATALDRHPEYDYTVKTLTTTECVIDFYKKRDTEWILRGTMEFTMDDAKRAQLIKAGSGWTKYPKAMLFARAISQGIRCFAPGCFTMPVYCPGELDQSRELEGVDVEIIEAMSVEPPKPEPLPFTNLQSALDWACDKLDIDLDAAQALLDDTPKDDKGNKSHNFYNKVLDILKQEG